MIRILSFSYTLTYTKLSYLCLHSFILLHFRSLRTLTYGTFSYLGTFCLLDHPFRLRGWTFSMLIILFMLIYMDKWDFLSAWPTCSFDGWAFLPPRTFSMLIIPFMLIYTDSWDFLWSPETFFHIICSLPRRNCSKMSLMELSDSAPIPYDHLLLLIRSISRKYCYLFPSASP